MGKKINDNKRQLKITVPAREQANHAGCRGERCAAGATGDGAEGRERPGGAPGRRPEGPAHATGPRGGAGSPSARGPGAGNRRSRPSSGRNRRALPEGGGNPAGTLSASGGTRAASPLSGGNLRGQTNGGLNCTWSREERGREYSAGARPRGRPESWRGAGSTRSSSLPPPDCRRAKLFAVAASPGNKRSRFPPNFGGQTSAWRTRCGPEAPAVPGTERHSHLPAQRHG